MYTVQLRLQAASKTFFKGHLHTDIRTLFCIFVECLHKVLEEILLLLRVWHKRVNHKFTAHLERKIAEEDLTEEPDSGFGVRLRLDY